MKISQEHYKTNQGILPMFISDFLDINDPVIAFDKFMEGIDSSKYLKNVLVHETGRVRYNPVNMLKTVLFGFMTNGYMSLRELEDNCKVNIRFMYLMNNVKPSYRTFGNFINEVLEDSIEDIFADINKAIFEEERVDLTHIYIDGTKLEANANKYSWVWKKATEKSRYKLYEKVTTLMEEINAELSWQGIHIETNTEYNPEQLDKIAICGPNRNSYSKTDTSATFMRMKKDYMGNDQLLPAYNIQVGVADEYIAVLDVNQYRSDMDCFVPLMEKFNDTYGFYPTYPVADAGYGSYNNYIYCEQKGMEKYMKFPMFKKETDDKKYRDNPFRVVNFKIDDDGIMRCPNNKKFIFKYRQAVRGNQYGRQEERYECEDCSGCPYAKQCKKTDRNRTVCLNKELTAIHKEVIDNLESIQGALLRMNRSIQAEGTFGIMKNDRNYKRIVRKGIKSVKLELYLVAIGQNLYKYHNKMMRIEKVA